jgi:hypothetical protein
MFALSLQEEHAVVLPPIVLQKAKSTPSSRQQPGWL